jgi:hypothetical protein
LVYFVDIFQRSEFKIISSMHWALIFITPTAWFCRVRWWLTGTVVPQLRIRTIPTCINCSLDPRFPRQWSSRFINPCDCIPVFFMSLQKKKDHETLLMQNLGMPETIWTLPSASSVFRYTIEIRYNCSCPDTG